MAETDTDNSNTQRRRNKIVVTGGVGGIAGVLIIGGVVAVVSLLRNRASRKRSDVNNPNPTTLKTSDVNDEGEGIRSLIQTGGDDASGASSSQIDCDLEPEEAVQTPIMEDKSYIEGNEEIQISSQNHKIESGSSLSTISDGVSDTIREGVPLTSSDRVSDTITGGVPEEVSALDTDRGLITDDSPTLPSLPLKEAADYTDDDSEDEESEEEEESSDEEEDETGREGSGDSSIGSNSEAIWPAESIEKVLSVLKDREETEKIAKAEEDAFEMMKRLAIKKDSGFESINQSFLRSKPSLLILLLLALGLLYLLFAHHLPLYHPSDSQLSSSP